MFSVFADDRLVRLLPSSAVCRAMVSVRKVHVQVRIFPVCGSVWVWLGLGHQERGLLEESELE